MSQPDPRETPPAPPSTPSDARIAVVAGFWGLAAFALSFRLILGGGLEQTAALFVGLPTLLGCVTVLVARPKTALGIALEVVTLSLLASAVLFQEGFVCIVFAAPLFYGIAIAVAVLMDYARGARGGPRAFALALLPLWIASTEGVLFSLPRTAEVTATAWVPAGVEEARMALAQPPDLSVPLPPLLRIGFPVPEQATGEGLRLGDQRVIHFGGGEGKPGDMVLRVAQASPDAIRFALVRDESHIAHWLRWDMSTVRLTPEGSGTRVRWTVSYTRRLDPAWYFDPLQRIAVKQAAGWLIEATAGRAPPADR